MINFENTLLVISNTNFVSTYMEYDVYIDMYRCHTS